MEYSSGDLLARYQSGYTITIETVNTNSRKITILIIDVKVLLPLIRRPE